MRLGLAEIQQSSVHTEVAARVWNGKLGVRWVGGRINLFDRAVTQDEGLVVGLEQVVEST